jgi:hypothetical protein
MGFINPMLHHTDNEWSMDQPEAHEYGAQGKSITLWAVVVVLAGVLGALVYYGYRTVKTQDIRITHIFGDQGTLNTLGQRADAAESQLRSLANDWQSMGQSMTKLEGRVATDVKQTRTYAESLTQKLHQQMIAEMDSRTSSLDERLRKIESEQSAQSAQMAQVEANLKQDISSVREENGRDLSGVRQEQESNARDLSDLSHKFDRRRLDFELAKGQAKELAPGISLRIRGTNSKHQQYQGTLSLAPDNRTMWLRDQSADEPVRFFSRDGGEPFDLVVTNVTKKDVAGYLLAPVKPSAASGAIVGEGTAMEKPPSQ